ncbi:MAG: UDP-N-acetylmuramate dehydrogenase [Planctomycetota bacterium]|nr:UDP-N-acetylmuramate dehydrogenase [Planctomycetota bacterium]
MVLPTVFADAARRAEALGAPALGTRTSLRVGGRPDFLFEPETEAEAEAVVRHCRDAGVRLRYLGGGYNLLVRDGPIRGAVLATRRLQFLEITDTQVRVGAGNSFPGLVKTAIELGIPGLPGCPGIPGTVGGVVFMNAGGRFGSVADALVEVTYLDPEGASSRRVIEAGDLGYRTSRFDGCLVTGATFRRDPAFTQEAAQALYDDAMKWKRETQPLSAKSAGCIFKNPDGPEGPRSAGRLIDEAGLKGAQIGGARVSPVHANFIENTGDATAADVHALIVKIQRTVFAAFGVELELEVKTW